MGPGPVKSGLSGLRRANPQHDRLFLLFLRRFGPRNTLERTSEIISSSNVACKGQTGADGTHAFRPVSVT